VVARLPELSTKKVAQRQTTETELLEQSLCFLLISHHSFFLFCFVDLEEKKKEVRRRFTVDY